MGVLVRHAYRVDVALILMMYPYWSACAERKPSSAARRELRICFTERAG